MLVLLHGDGYVEVFAEKHVDVRIEQVPFVGTKRGETIAEEYIDYVLPRRYRDLHWPGKLRGSAVLRKLTPVQLVDRDNHLLLLGAVDLLQSHFGESRWEWTTFET